MSNETKTITRKEVLGWSESADYPRARVVTTDGKPADGYESRDAWRWLFDPEQAPGVAGPGCWTKVQVMSHSQTKGEWIDVIDPENDQRINDEYNDLVSGR